MRLAVIVPALKLPESSRLTMVFGMLLLVASCAATAPEAMVAADCPPTELTTVAFCVPVTSPASDPVKLIAEEIDPVMLPVTLPIRFAVIVPALKFPAEFRATIVEEVLELVADVAEFAILPAE